MQTKRSFVTLGVSLLLTLFSACQFSFTTANISSLKLGADSNVSKPSSNFAATDTIHAVAELSNAPGGVKGKGRMAIEDVPGKKSGPVQGLETTVDLPGSGHATFDFSPPPDGWPKGKYKVEVFMLDQDEQKDQKAANFTVS